MTWLRHSGRHVHHTSANYLRAQLIELGWLGTAGGTGATAFTGKPAVPWGGTPVTFLTAPVVLEDGLVDGIGPGTVAITIGDEVNPTQQEMGGPLSSQEYPLFIDCFHDTEETTLALATDVRDIFLGRLPGTQRWLDVIDQSNSSAAPGWRMEFEDIERIRPETKVRLHWQVVHVTAYTYFPEVTY